MLVPGIFITFRTTAADAIQRSEKGTVALLIRDAAASGPLTLTRLSQVPDNLSAENQAYIRRAFLGYVTAPNKILVYVDEAEAENLTAGLAWASTQSFDYLCGPPDIKTEEAQAVAAWVKEERADGHMVKAVLPDQAADSEAIVNFTTAGIQVGEDTLTAAQYCSRMAGLIAGTPMTMACTYAPLTEVADFTRLSGEQADAAVDAGQLILLHDGVKAKVARGVNSLVTTTKDKGASFQKIKIVELLDMVFTDLRQSITDSYIGKYANSYDNKLVLVTAIKTYLDSLERDGLIQSGSSVVEIDADAQAAWLAENGTDTSGMDEQALREANTGSHVFLRIAFKPLDAIEDVHIPITI